MKQQMISWQWHQLDHTQINCISDQHLISQFFTRQMLFLTPNQQCQSIKKTINHILTGFYGPAQGCQFSSKLGWVSFPHSLLLLFFPPSRPSPKIQLVNLGWRMLIQDGAPATNAFLCITSVEIADGDNDFLWLWRYKKFTSVITRKL